MAHSLHLGNKSGKSFLFYINTIRALLVGHTSTVDIVLKDPKNRLQLRKYVRSLLDCGIVELPNLEKEYYRGILLSDKDSIDLKLKPLDNLSTISFTEDINIAKDFADTNSAMSSFVMQLNPDYKGYLIKHKPEKQEVLFHYSWFDKLGLQHFPELDYSVVEEQKELILFQQGLTFNLERV